MGNNLTSDKPFSLREEMRRRKLAEFDRDLEQRKQARLQGKRVPPSEAATITSTIRPISPPPASRQIASQAVAPGAAPIARMSFQNLTSRDKIMLMGIGAAVFIALVLVGVLIIP